MSSIGYVLVGVGIGLLAAFILHVRRLVGDLLKREVGLSESNGQLQVALGDLQKRVDGLEAQVRRRIPQAVADEVLDAMAVLDRLSMDFDTLNAVKENVRGHLVNALSAGTKRERQ